MDPKLPEQLNLFGHKSDEKKIHDSNESIHDLCKSKSANIKVIHLGGYFSKEKKEKVEELADRLTSHLL